MMTQNNIFIERLELMLIMLKAVLKGYPTGKYRQEAIIDNALELNKAISNIDLNFLMLKTSEHVFRERVKLLCIMAQSAVSYDYPMGYYRQEAVLNNIEILSEDCISLKSAVLYDFLKVA